MRAALFCAAEQRQQCRRAPRGRPSRRHDASGQSPHTVNTVAYTFAIMKSCTMYKITYVSRKKKLEDRGAALVDTLFDRQSNSVTFAQFRNGLLSVLDRDPIQRQENSINTESGASALAKVVTPPHSDDDSSGREVAPKFVFGSKKYGRRSRPQRGTSEDSSRHRVASESRLDSVRTRQRMRCKRSSSAMESREDTIGDDDPANLDHDRLVNRDRALALCRELHMHGIDQSLVDRVFAALATDEVTVGEFFDRLNASLTTSIATSLDGVTTDGSFKSNSDIVSSDAVIDTWKRAGVQKPMGLLVELGFGDAVLRLQDLERVLDDELRANSSLPDARLVLAAYTLSRMRLESAWRFLDVARSERDKLRDDLAEANRRARLLAQDVDENHARIEAELKSSLRQMEIRQIEIVRAAATEAGAERERAAAQRTALEEEVARRAEVEFRLRTEITSLRERVNEYQERATVAETRAAQAEREQTRLQEEVRRAESVGVELAAQERAAADELDARLRELLDERQHLRDRCDELAAALEGGAGQRGGGGRPARCWQDEVDSDAVDTSPDICKFSSKSLERQESRKLVEKIWNFLANLREISVREKNKCGSCDSILGSIPILQREIRDLKEQSEEPAASRNIIEKLEIGSQTEGCAQEDVEALTKTLAEVKRSHDLEKDSLSGVVKELELSLEQMKIEYEKCEEYWSSKLEEERSLSAEEQRAGDERLADLAARIADYERRFTPAHALPTIDERDGLELQVNDLQDEFDAYRKAKEAELAAKSRSSGGGMECGVAAPAPGGFPARAHPQHPQHQQHPQHPQHPALSPTERSPAKAGLHVNFSDKGEVKERREKFLTAKYGSHQMALIRKRLAVEMWLYDELQKLYEIPGEVAAGASASSNSEVEVDIDELLDMDSDDIRRRHLTTLLAEAKKPQKDVHKFINELLEKAKTL